MRTLFILALAALLLGQGCTPAFDEEDASDTYVLRIDIIPNHEYTRAALVEKLEAYGYVVPEPSREPSLNRVDVRAISAERDLDRTMNALNAETDVDGCKESEKADVIFSCAFGDLTISGITAILKKYSVADFDLTFDDSMVAEPPTEISETELHDNLLQLETWPEISNVLYDDPFADE